MTVPAEKVKTTWTSGFVTCHALQTVMLVFVELTAGVPFVSELNPNNAVAS